MGRLREEVSPRTIRMLKPLARRLVRIRRGRRLLLADNCVDPARIPPVEAERLLTQFAHCDVAAHLAANTGADGESLGSMGWSG